ncbi:hypothetical protein D3C76_1358910 [compost metagenome]
MDRLLLFCGTVFAVHQNQLATVVLQLLRRLGKYLAEITAVIEGVGDHQANALGFIGGQISRQ